MFRSLLFIPANNPSMLQNADIFMSDAIIFDLEDAVSLDDKDNARNLLDAYLNTQASLPSQIVVRVNPVNTDLIKEDLNLLLSKKIDYLLLPKANMDSLFVLKQMLEVFEKDHNLEKTKVICLIEETKAVLQAAEIASDERVKAILLGAEDLTSELEIERTNQGDEILFARSQIIYASQAENIISIDTPFTDISDQEALKADCIKAKSLGMKAKTAIHPSQLDIINEVFSPSPDMIEWAKGLMDEYLNHPRGVFQYRGKMVDKPVIEKAKKIIEKAKQFDLM